MNCIVSVLQSAQDDWAVDVRPVHLLQTGLIRDDSLGVRPVHLLQTGLIRNDSLGVRPVHLLHTGLTIRTIDVDGRLRSPLTAVGSRLLLPAELPRLT